MDSTTTSPTRPPNQLPIELTNLVVGLIRDQKADLAQLACVSRTFYYAAIPHLYTHVSLSGAAKASKGEWVKTVALWARTMSANEHLASLVTILELDVPECDLPVLYRRTLTALQSCTNLRELEIRHESHATPVSWLFPERPSFTLDKLTSYIPASAGVARMLESQPSIRTLRLETFHLRLPLSRGSLPNLAHYTGSSRLIVQARVQGAIWENLVHAELHDAYRPSNGMLDAMPRLKSLDVIVAAWNHDSLEEIARKCEELRCLTLRDANGLFHSWQDGRLIRFATVPSFTNGLAGLSHLSSLTINAPYPLYHGRAPAHVEKAQLMEWHVHCPTLRHFHSPTGLEWVFVPAASLPSASSESSSQETGPAGQWLVIAEPTSTSPSTFATDPGIFGMRRAGNMRERQDVGDVDELVAIIERLNREHLGR